MVHSSTVLREEGHDLAGQGDLFGELLVSELSVSRGSAGDTEMPSRHGGDDALAQRLVELEAMGSQGIAERWLIDPVGAFGRWKNTQRFRGVEFEEHSVEQYTSMWGRYCEWLRQKRLSLEVVGGAEVDRFLEGLRGGRLGELPVAPSTKRRYLFLLHRTYAHLEQLGVVAKNPVAELPALARHQANERPARMLMREAQEQAYIDWCMAQPAQRWDQVRNRALRLLFLASGITVTEARLLKVTEIAVIDEDPDNGFAVLMIPAHGNTPAREAPVSSFGVGPLVQWLEARYPLGGEGDVLFASGRPYTFCSIIDPDQGHMRPSEHPLSAEEIYDIVSAAMRGCGFEGRRAGPSTLRNTFMARQIRQGIPLDRIRDWVGLRTTEQLRALQRQVPRRADGLVPV